jgi:aspartate dehydrogenase
LNLVFGSGETVKTVGIIGCGAIGTLIAEAVESGIIACDKLILYDADMVKAERLKSRLHVPVAVVSSVGEMVGLKPTVIVEAASQQAARQYIREIVDAGVDLIVMSVGALLDLDVKSDKIHVPSGAIGGLDAISSVDLAGVDEVVLVTRKNPKVLDLDNRVEKVVYEGDAKEAVRRFPREMNVAATLALTVKPEKVKVQVVSDPRVKRNVHEVTVKWKFGEMFFRFSNDPHPENPKTSALAAWSAIKLLKELLEKE